jgi:1,4-alpha-glucan branching enzyme
LHLLNETIPTTPRFLTMTLHAHLPYVVNHGTWPHGMEWLHEAAAETYLPLLRMLGNLERDGIPAHFNINLSPILLEQLVHPVFLAEFPKYVTRKILAAKEDEQTFAQAGEQHYAETARFWQRIYQAALDDFNGLGGQIVAGFRRLHESGMIDLITGAATHGYLPLLGTDESVRAQIRTAVKTFVRHIGQAPAGIWIPECGYRPAGFWSYPVKAADGASLGGFERIGVEQAVGESDLDFFFVDTHLIGQTGRAPSPYGGEDSPAQHSPQRPLYQPYTVEGAFERDHPVAAFARDPRTGLQVWSGEEGYPADDNYLDFHKKRYPGGHRYWQVTGRGVAMEDKQPYWPERGSERVHAHAAHFVRLVGESLAASPRTDNPPILNAPFDAELFGHWWFEGPVWLEAVCRAIHAQTDVKLISCRDYLAAHKPTSSIAMHEGSWGTGGDDRVWLNPETNATYALLYPAEIATREICSTGLWRDSDLGTRIVKQMCRELLLLEASDWQFLITTGAARDYAEVRFATHHSQFQSVKRIYEAFADTRSIGSEDEARLVAIEVRDGVFPDIDPEFWMRGAHARGAAQL